METFTVLKELTENPHYKEQRQKSLAGLSNAIIDTPIREIIKGDGGIIKYTRKSNSIRFDKVYSKSKKYFIKG